MKNEYQSEPYSRTENEERSFEFKERVFQKSPLSNPISTRAIKLSIAIFPMRV